MFLIPLAAVAIGYPTALSPAYASSVVEGMYANYLICSRIVFYNTTYWVSLLAEEGSLSPELIPPGLTPYPESLCGVYGWRVLKVEGDVGVVRHYLNVSYRLRGLGRGEARLHVDVKVDFKSMSILDDEGSVWGRWVFFLTPEEASGDGSVVVMRKWFNPAEESNDQTVVVYGVRLNDDPIVTPSGLRFASSLVSQASTLEVPAWARREVLMAPPTLVLQYAWDVKTLLLLGYSGSDDVLLNKFRIMDALALMVERGGRLEQYRYDVPYSVLLNDTNVFTLFEAEEAVGGASPASTDLTPLFLVAGVLAVLSGLLLVRRLRSASGRP